MNTMIKQSNSSENSTPSILWSFQVPLVFYGPSKYRYFVQLKF